MLHKELGVCVSTSWLNVKKNYSVIINFTQNIGAILKFILLVEHSADEGSANPGEQVSLLHEHNNPHDHNAMLEFYFN